MDRLTVVEGEERLKTEIEYLDAALDSATDFHAQILATIKSTLEPIADQDWHGKWRINKVIKLCSNKESDNG